MLRGKLIPITSKTDAERLQAMHKRLSGSISRLQLSPITAGDKAEADNLLEEAFKDLRAIEAGYLALTNTRLVKEGL